MFFRKGTVVMLRSSATRAMVRVLVASQLLSGVPALAAPQDRPRASEQAPPPETRKAEPPRAPNRTVPKVDPPPTVFSLSASPSDAELTRARIFAEPLVPMPHGTTPAENRALARAIDEYAQIGQSEMVAPLLTFLAQYPQSAWRPSLLANLGTVYRANGYLGKALNAWEQAWIASKAETDLRAKAVADFALGEWLDLSAKVGHADAIEGRFAEIGGRNVTGRAAQKLGMAREAFWVLRFHHEEAAASGPAALEAILGFTAYAKHESYAPNPLLIKYHAMPSGTSLAELKALAKRIGLSYELAFRTGNSPFPIPSIIHWRIDHYSAVVKQDGGKYLLVDPILGGERWLTP